MSPCDRSGMKAKPTPSGPLPADHGKEATTRGPLARAIPCVQEVDLARHLTPEWNAWANKHSNHYEDIREGGELYEVTRHDSFEGPIVAVVRKDAVGKTLQVWASSIVHPVP